MRNDPPLRTVIASSSNTDLGVVGGELPTINSQWVRSVGDQEGINSGVRIRGSVLECPIRLKSVQSEC